MASIPKLLPILVIFVTVLAGCAQPNATPTTGTTPTSPAQTDKTPNIASVTVGTDAAYPPFEDTLADTSIAGFDVDVMKEIGNRSGFTVTFQNSQFTAIIPSVQNGAFGAGMSAFSITDERRQQIDFSIPYYENRLLVAVLSGETGITSEADLAGKKVCTQEGTTSEFYLRDNLGFGNDSLLLVPTAPQCKDALLRTGSDIDALMIDAAFVRNVIETSNGELKQAFAPIDADEQFGIVVKKGNSELLTAINEALTSMRSDGRLDAIADKWKV